MILELDCGNTRIKWRLLASDGGRLEAQGYVDSADELKQALASVADASLRWCRAVSVRGDEETRQLLAEISHGRAMDIRLAEPATFCAGVRNGYRDFERLGLDRWLAVVGGYHLAEKACLVVDLGTAVTADFVSRDGQHLGGYISPGLPLMRAQLRSHTRRIRYDDSDGERAMTDLVPGRSTAEAVERGCVQMLRGFVREQCLAAEKLLGQGFEVLLTGGDASLVADVWPSARVQPDLVFVGLGLACPVERG